MNKKKILGLVVGAVLLTSTIFIAAFTTDSKSSGQIEKCPRNHNHEDSLCISMDVQEYWNDYQISDYNRVMDERNEYIDFLKRKGYDDNKINDAIMGYDNGLRNAEDVFTRDVFEAKGADIKTEQK